jgi:hypothetical protein
VAENDAQETPVTEAPSPEANTHSPDPRPEKPLACAACGDTRRVTLSLQGQDGPIYREVPCPECGPGVKLADPAQIVTREDLRKLAALVLMALALAAVAFLLTARKPGGPSVFEQAVKEVENE